MGFDDKRSVLSTLCSLRVYDARLFLTFLQNIILGILNSEVLREFNKKTSQASKLTETDFGSLVFLGDARCIVL